MIYAETGSSATDLFYPTSRQKLNDKKIQALACIETMSQLVFCRDTEECLILIAPNQVSNSN